MTEEGKELEPSEENQILLPEAEEAGEGPVIGELIRELGEDKVNRVFQIVHRELELHCGPLPHPRIFGQYEAVLPGAADRIIKMAEKQQDHRLSIEKNVIDGDIKRANLGLILGFSLFVLFGIGGFALLLIGKDVQGYSLLGTSLVGGIANFIRVGRERIKQTSNVKPNRKKKKKKKTSAKVVEETKEVKANSASSEKKPA